jgi:hypothetical protein
LYSGGCSSSCSPSTVTVLGIKKVKKCCQKDLCNSSSNIGASKIIIAFVFALAMSIFRLFKD